MKGFDLGPAAEEGSVTAELAVGAVVEATGKLGLVFCSHQVLSPLGPLPCINKLKVMYTCWQIQADTRSKGWQPSAGPEDDAEVRNARGTSWLIVGVQDFYRHAVLTNVKRGCPARSKLN